MSKKIHVAWPVLCAVELADAMSKLAIVLEMVKYRGDKDGLVLAVKSAIVASNKALAELEQAYGK